jgi:hypothetical protein
MAKKWYEEEDTKGRKLIKKKDKPLETQAARYVNWLKNVHGKKIRVTSGDRDGHNHSKANAFDIVGIEKLPERDKEKAYKTALEMGLRIGDETKGKRGVGGWTGSHIHIDGSKGPSFIRGGVSGKANRAGRTKEENKANNEFLKYLDNLKNKDLGEEVQGPPQKEISRGPAGVMMKPEEEEKKKKEIESVSRASLISKIAPELKEEVIANPNINEEQTQQLVKHLSSDKSIKKAADKAVGLQPQSKSPSLVDQFKEALTFFAPQIIGGAIGGVEGYEEAGKLRDSYIDYKQDMAQLALQQTPNVRAAQQSEFLTQSGAPAVFNPNTGKYQDPNGNVVEASSLVSGKDMRQKESLVRADQRIQLAHDKFAIDLQKENQLTGAQQTKLAELDTTILSGGKLQEAFGNVETGPVIGRYNSMLEYFDSATPEATKLKAHATNLRLFYQRAMSGLQVNEKEMEMIANVIPDQNDAPTVFAAKLEVFNELTSLNKQAFLESIKTGQPLKGEVVQELIQKGTQFQGTSAPKRGTISEADIDNMSAAELKAFLGE